MLKTNNITNEAGTGAPNLPNGLALGTVTLPASGQADVRAALGLTIGTNVLAPNGDGSNLTNIPTLGVGQTWQNMIGSRAVANNYTNSTGKPIAVICGGNNGSTSVIPQVSFDLGTTWMTFARCDLPSGVAAAVGMFIVPVGATYRVGNFTTVSYWWELR
jgi:hypothetical protein